MEDSSLFYLFYVCPQEKVDVKKEKLPEPENVAEFLKRKKKEKSEKWFQLLV